MSEEAMISLVWLLNLLLCTVVYVATACAFLRFLSWRNTQILFAWTFVFLDLVQVAGFVAPIVLEHTDRHVVMFWVAYVGGLLPWTVLLYLRLLQTSEGEKIKQQHKYWPIAAIVVTLAALSVVQVATEYALFDYISMVFAIVALLPLGTAVFVRLAHRRRPLSRVSDVYLPTVALFFFAHDIWQTDAHVWVIGIFSFMPLYAFLRLVIGRKKGQSWTTIIRTMDELRHVSYALTAFVEQIEAITDCPYTRTLNDVMQWTRAKEKPGGTSDYDICRRRILADLQMFNDIYFDLLPLDSITPEKTKQWLQQHLASIHGHRLLRLRFAIELRRRIKKKHKHDRDAGETDVSLLEESVQHACVLESSSSDGLSGIELDTESDRSTEEGEKQSPAPSLVVHDSSSNSD